MADQPHKRGPYWQSAANSAPVNPWVAVLGFTGWITLAIGIPLAAADRDAPAELLLTVSLVTLTGWVIACALAWEIRAARTEHRDVEAE